MLVYNEGETVYIGDKEFKVEKYDESVQWDPFNSIEGSPGYRLYEVSGDYFLNPKRRTVRPEDVHHLPLRIRVRRIEEKLGLDDE